MEHDYSSRAFDSITYRSGQFGFFQKRIFIINTLIQSACLSILLYTTACMPGFEEGADTEMTMVEVVVSSTVYPVSNHTQVTTTTTNNMDTTSYSSNQTSATFSFGSVEDFIDSLNNSANMTDSVFNLPSSTISTPSDSTTAWMETDRKSTIESQTATVTWYLESTTDHKPNGNISSSSSSSSTENTTMASDTSSGYSTTSSSGHDHPLLSEILPKNQYLSALKGEDLIRLLSLLQGVGAIIGALVGGLMADIYGRRRPLYLAVAGMALSQCSVGLAGSWLMFLMSRTLAVGFAGASAVISALMIIEFVGPGWRDICACSCLWTFGSISLAVQSFLTSHWRWMAFSSGGLAMPLVGSFFTAVESARWLQCHHRFTEAEGLYRELISVNSAAVPEIMALLDQARACIVNNMHPKRFTFLDLFYNMKSTRWTLALIYTGMVSSCVYTCLLDHVRNVTGLAYLDGCLPFLIDLPLTWSVIVVNRCLGRRWCLFLYSIASGFALLSVLVLHVTGNVSNMPSLITGIALFGKIGVTASIALIFLTAIEMYPTVTRGMGVGVALASASGGALLSFPMMFLYNRHYTVPFIVYGGLMASIGLVGLFLPETLNQPLANVQQCRHRKIPLMEGSRLVGSPPSMWDTV